MWRLVRRARDGIPPRYQTEEGHYPTAVTRQHSRRLSGEVIRNRCKACIEQTFGSSLRILERLADVAVRFHRRQSARNMKRLGYRYPLVPATAAWMAPWTALSSDAGSVIALRLSLMPWLWVSDSRGAERELQRMIDEKGDALLETQLALFQAPWRF